MSFTHRSRTNRAKSKIPFSSFTSLFHLNHKINEGILLINLFYKKANNKTLKKYYLLTATKQIVQKIKFRFPLISFKS